MSIGVDLCEMVGQSQALDVQLQAHDLTDPRLPQRIEVVIYRLVQELLTNVVRHAQARHVIVQVMRHGPTAQVVVEDDGRGFDPSAAAPGVGLRSVRTRADYLGGTLDVQSQPGHGTTITIDFPVPEA